MNADTHDLPLYGTPDERTAWLGQVEHAPTPAEELAVAWLLREEEPERARRWLARPSNEWDTALHWRAAVLEAELQLLDGGNAAAQAAAQALLAPVMAAGAAAVLADLHHLLHRLAEQRAERDLALQHIDAAIAAAQAEPRRLLALRSDRLRSFAYSDPQAAWEEAQRSLPVSLDGLSDDCAATLADCWGVLHGFRAEYPQGTRWLIEAFERSTRTGQRRRALVAASNLGYMYTQSGQHESALHWLRQGSALAQGGHWPGLEGGLLTNLAQAQRELGQIDAARECLQQAFAALARVPAGRSLSIALGALGRIELESGQAEAALSAYERMAAQPSARDGDLALIAGLGRVRAMLALGQAATAQAPLQAVLALARKQHSQAYAIEAMGLHADLLAALGDAQAGLAYEATLQAADALPGYQIDPQLLEAAAMAHMRQGQHERACALALRASRQRQSAFNESTRRALAALRSELAVARAESAAQLAEMQLQLVQKERHASLGAMVAGVAHEINTPVGNALLVANAMQAELQVVLASLESGQAPRRSQLLGVLAQLAQGLEVIEAGMHSAARLVGSFKQVAVERSNETRCRFALARVCDQCLATLEPQLRKAGIVVQMDVTTDWELDSYPGALGQVLLNLLGNAIAHAFQAVASPRIALLAVQGRADSLLLTVQDNGVGMSAAVQRRIFEPFFTTKFGQGGSGLGLSISLNLTEKLLGGRLSLDSQPGHGSCFTLELPLVAPRHTEF